MKVRNIIGNSGNPVRNQFTFSDEKYEYFQSYSTIIARRSWEHGVELDERSWDCSKTTGKYRNIFLGESKKETEHKIKTGEYKLVNLNN